MKRHFICFDPGDLEESYLPNHAEKAARAGSDFVELAVSGRTIRLGLDEIRQVERDINSQTYARDFMLIDQSDMIVSLVPTLPDGRAAVERELQHAHEAAKEVYVIWTAKQSPSVFVTQTATKVFNNPDDAVTFFKEKG
jgi:hypothetical protein